MVCARASAFRSDTSARQKMLRNTADRDVPSEEAKRERQRTAVPSMPSTGFDGTIAAYSESTREPSPHPALAQKTAVKGGVGVLFREDDYCLQLNNIDRERLTEQRA